MRKFLTAMGMALAVTFAAPAIAAPASQVVAGPPSALITPAFEYFSAPQETYTERSARNPNAADLALGTLGYSFTLDLPSSVNALGYWSDDPAFVSGQVGIWNSLGVLVSTALVTRTNEVGGYFYTVLTTPVLLARGNYVIGGSIEEGDKFPIFLTQVNYATGYTWTGSREGVEIGFAEPKGAEGVGVGGYGDQGIALVNFSFSQISAVPEPATWAMMLLGFGVVGTSLRRRRKALAVA